MTQIEKSKYLFFYNGIPFTINSLEELAVKLFGMKIYLGA